MGDSNKNKKSSKTDFIRYHNDKMNSAERNAFEKDLQKDPFSQEALEGLASISSQEALKDISNLQNQLKKRIVNQQRFIFYRIAASMAVLIAISSIFIIIEVNKPTQHIASNINRAEPAEIAESPPITLPESKVERSEKPGSQEKESHRSGNKNNKQKAEGADIPDNNNLIADYQHKDSISEIAVKQPEEDLKSGQIAAESPIAVGAKRSELIEEVRSENAALKAVSEKEDMPAGYKPPQPAVGKSVFEKYVRDNLHRPDTLSSEQEAIVDLSFLVLSDGSVDSIKVIRSPGKAFSDEAIRLLNSGPAWKPAEQNGKIIEDEARVRIVFE